MKARIGVIGCGWWATQAHLPALKANPDATIAAIADPNDENRHRAAETFEVSAGSVFADAGEMLKRSELDGAIVAVPHAYHAGMARLALDRGLHVLLEKPMTISPSDARMLAELAEAKGRELIIGYPWHFNRQVLALRAAIAAGRIGTTEYVSCQFASVARDLYRGDTATYREVSGYTMINPPGQSTYSDPRIAGGGQGQTQVTHSAALLFFLTGLRPVSVASTTESFELKVDLADAVAIRFANGAIGSLGSTGSVLPGQNEILLYHVFGDRGHITFDVNEGVALIHGPGGAVDRLPDLPVAERYPEWATSSNLVDVTLGRAANGSPAWNGVLTVEFIDAMYRAARGGTAVPLKA